MKFEKKAKKELDQLIQEFKLEFFFLPEREVYHKVLIYLNQIQARLDHSDSKAFLMPIFTSIIGSFIILYFLNDNDNIFEPFTHLFQEIWSHQGILLVKILLTLLGLIGGFVTAFLAMFPVLLIPLIVFLKDRKESSMNLLKIEILIKLIED